MTWFCPTVYRFELSIKMNFILSFSGGAKKIFRNSSLPGNLFRLEEKIDEDSDKATDTAADKRADTAADKRADAAADKRTDTAADKGTDNDPEAASTHKISPPKEVRFCLGAKKPEHCGLEQTRMKT